MLSELELRFIANDQLILCALESHSKTPDKESLSCYAKFYKIDGEILEAGNACEVSSCVRMRLNDCSRNAGDNARELSI